MNDLLNAIVAGIEIIFLGSETILEFLSDTTILGATLYAWFLGYLVLDTIFSIFIQVQYDNNELESIADFIGDSATPEEMETEEIGIDYELD
jgi:hypothetical protein